jgi:hypothetical protein
MFTTKLTKKQMKFVLAARTIVGNTAKVISRDQVKEVLAKNPDIKWPGWLTANHDPRLDRGMYRLPFPDMEDIVPTDDENVINETLENGENTNVTPVDPVSNLTAALDTLAGDEFNDDGYPTSSDLDDDFQWTYCR